MPTAGRAPLRRLLARYLAARAAAERETFDDPANDSADTPAGRELSRLRARLLEAAMPLARCAVDIVCASPPPPLTREDLLSHAHEGLLAAVDTFSPGRGARFETYAVSKARWAVLDALRAADPLPRSTRAPLARAAAQRDKLTAKRGRVPDAAEVARASGLSEAQLDALSARAATANAVHLEEPAGTDGGRTLGDELPDPSARGPEDALLAAEVAALLRREVSALPPRQARVVYSYFFRSLTLREIGAEVGLTQGRMSQILKASLAALRPTLAGQGLGDALREGRVRPADPAGNSAALASSATRKLA